MNKYTHHVPPLCTEDVQILYADEHVLVAGKPAGLLSVPGRFAKDCVVSRMQYDYPGATVVHRLDLDTSGLMVLALSRLAVSDLNRQFRERQVSKVYIARVFGHLGDEQGVIDLPIGPDPDNRPRQRIDYLRGKASLTRFEVISKDVVSSLLKLMPETGRSHQLRIHLASVGHAILGCDLYAPPKVLAMRDRLCLHASELGFSHPVSGEALGFELPCDF